MTHAIGDILGGKRSNEPEAFMVIRQFVQQKFNLTPQLQLQNKSILITVPSAAVAGSLQLELHNLESQLAQPHKLRVRIG